MATGRADRPDDAGPGATLARLRAALARRIGVDRRGLAAFRVGLGAVLLLDLALRARALTAHYTDAGVLPRATLRDLYPVLSRLSLHALSGSVWLQVVLFVLAGVAALALLVGYRTRLATVLTAVLLVSLHARNPLVLNGGDSVLRRLLLWSVFLPLGARWSVDAARGRGGPRPSEGDGTLVTTAVAAGLLVQVVLVYATNAALKLDASVWLSGEALWTVFHLDEFTTPLGAALATFPSLLAVLEVAWVVTLLGSVALLATTGWRRTVVFGVFAGAHAAMFLTMRLGVFPLVSLVALVPFLPPGVWDRVAPAVDRVGRRLGIEVDPAGARWGRDVGGLLSASARSRLRRLRAVVAVLAVVVLVAWNATAVGLLPARDPVPGSADPTEDTWGMFDDPPDADLYVVPVGRGAAGPIDALRGGQPRQVVPPDGAAWYPSARWRKFLRSVRDLDDRQVWGAVARGFCDHSGGNFRSVRLELTVEPTASGEDGPPRTVRLGAWPCPDARGR